MLKRVILPGLVGGLVLFAWTFAANGLFGFKREIDMKHIPAERQVHQVLKESVLEPGRYTVNPQLSSTGRFPDGEPVYGILYGGVGHEAAGRLALIELGVIFLAPIIGAWMLSDASPRTRASYRRRVLFFAAIGLLLALFGDLRDFGIGTYPLRDAVLLAAHDVVAWTAVGLAVAWRMQPDQEP
jgi:hypothetical protein